MPLTEERRNESKVDSQLEPQDVSEPAEELEDFELAVTNEDETEEKDSFLKRHKFYLLAVVAISLPLVVNGLMWVRIPTPSSLEAPHWLSFWGSYLGGLLGSVAALIALNESRKQAEAQKEINKENNRLSMLPTMTLDKALLHASPENIENVEKYFSLFSNTMRPVTADNCSARLNDAYQDSPSRIFLLECSNVGKGPALSVYLTCEETGKKWNIGNYSAGKSRKFFVLIPPFSGDRKKAIYNFTVSYRDVFKYRYIASYTLRTARNKSALGLKMEGESFPIPQ